MPVEYPIKHREEFRHHNNSRVNNVFCLDEKHKKQLKDEFDVEAWTFGQHVDEAAFIPAGCPHQVSNRQEKKGRGPQPMWYVTGDELNSVPLAIGEIAAYAEIMPSLLLHDGKSEIAMTDAVKGKYFFLESDIKGPYLKL
ncbi:transcription factor jumonji domain-containing protein [Striga asiatica]|uniref:Transcription factor jumonji domain-containing protein n=1 Tax=Striga asiatica TaxID=4170 RepID=A0A5A7P7D5_STRAF|nr:transcription factor jumonji domain-containing protein [Striga asiatica]